MPSIQSSSCSSPSQVPSFPSEDSLTSLIGAALLSSQEEDASLMMMPTFGNRNNNQNIAEILGEVLEIIDYDSPVSMDDDMEGIFSSRLSSSPPSGAKQ
mmetsp:Transcript_1280/g.2561  ORF Transcript_1280/g.2561 Transcript_1280/m.2561 type:complete len:99 (+) Transcript_1280:95-391(+)|eukprot:CAMPEP_0113631868 /NCGR_PEP_ID=MMETSP0017_2-20120614/16561_1 /TAXON_ID=2856 /ORGANISM="Cylindrotheca closterium" /LENGTH=98 /DNA_ID=CAMNT_0000542395 /DNA_START=61 /DNA_END=357 /DNA_ORIENTATION=+ /assembly_acc=CAM_ASM_000147